jgi:hypothetical protein
MTMELLTKSILLSGSLTAAATWAWASRLAAAAQIAEEALAKDGRTPAPLADLLPNAVPQLLLIAGTSASLTATLGYRLHGWSLAAVLLVAIVAMAALALQQLPPAGSRFFRRQILGSLRHRQLEYQRRGDDDRSDGLAMLYDRVDAIRERRLNIWIR